MANNNGCGCSGRHNYNSGFGCLSSVGRRYRWDNYPYYGGPCPDEDGVYDCDGDDREEKGGRCGSRGRQRRRRRHCQHSGIFMGMMPMAVAPNGIVPLINNSCLCGGDGFSVNSGMVSIEKGGTYLATYTVRIPEGTALDSTITLNVNDASQSSAIAEVGGDGPQSYTAQAIIDVNDYATVTLRSTEAINIANTSPQPLFTLSLVQLDGETEE